MRKLAQFALILLVACGHRSSPRSDAGAVPTFVRPSPPAPEPTERPWPPHKPVLPHPLVTRCLAQEKGDWEHLKGCLTAISSDVMSDDAGVDSGHKLKGPSPFPPSNNPSWLIPEWDYDNASRLATCSDSNTCVDSAHPCCTRQQVLSRWGTDRPVFRQNTVEMVHSAWPRNPAADQFEVRPRVQSAAQYSMQCDLVQVATGTLASVVAKNVASPGQRLNVTLAAGLTPPTLVFDSSRGSYSWIVLNTSGNAWDMGQPLTESHVAPPDSPPNEDNGWTTGDNYVAYSIIAIPLRTWAVSWEDLVDSPDSRPTLANCAVGQGINSGAGSDTAMVRFELMGDALLNVAFLNASSVRQVQYTHGSRAGSTIINPFGCGSGNGSATACADGNAARLLFAGTEFGPAVDKQMQLYAGAANLPFMSNVELRDDFQALGAGTLSGQNGYNGFYTGPSGNGITMQGGALVPDASAGTAIVWGPGEIDLTNEATFVYLDPPSTNLQQHNAFIIDNSFTGSACDFTHNLGMCTPGLPVSTSITTLQTLLATAVSAGGYGGTIVGPYHSIITDNLRRNDTTTPYFIFDGGINGVGCGPGQSCTITSSFVNTTVSSGVGIVVTGGPAYTVALSNPVAVVNGGTSDTSLTAHNVLLGEGTSAVAFAAPGTAGLPLVSNGASSDPVFSAITPSAINPGSAGQIISTCSSTSQWMTETGDVQFLSCSGTNRSNQILNLQGVSVTLASLTNGDVLTYNSTGPKWQNQAVAQKIAVISGVNHGSAASVGTTYGTFATVTLTVPSGAAATIDCTSAVEWQIADTGSHTLTFGSSQNSTAAPSSTMVMTTPAGSISETISGSMVDSYPGTSAGSQTYRILVKDPTSTGTSIVNANLLCIQH